MVYTHIVQAFENGIFIEKKSSSIRYYSVARCLDDGDEVDEVDIDTLPELYKWWQEQKSADASCNEHGCKYHLYYHEIAEENGNFIDYKGEGKVYKRGSRIFFKPI